ncbi:GrpB family protein [Paenibacillus sp. GCM10027628]|uniref:GrpB family protein n=1 Tax=Paenibacillus sp. GCM10027628 TaxID=3273413 RepID=UPI00362793BC
MGASLIVSEYDPSWVQLFQQLRCFVTPVLSDFVVTIEHVGSTSVPGLAAKPIVDIDVVVPTQELARRYHNDHLAYTNAKGEFVRGILQRAGWN